MRVFAQAHEHAGFDRILVPASSSSPDTLLTVAYAASSTQKIGLLLAHRPGFVAPTLAARQLATLDHYTGGRVAVHYISGGSDEDQQRDGDFLGHDERYARTDEYLGLLRRVWTENKPFDHEGTYYRVKGAWSEVKPLQAPYVPIYFGGASAPALQVAGRHADVYALWGESLAQAGDLVRRVRAEAAKHGRSVEFSISFRPILGATEDASLGQGRPDPGRNPPPARRPGLCQGRRAAKRRRAPAAGRCGQGRPRGRAAVDRDCARNRRPLQHHVAGRHARAGGRRAAGVLRPGHHAPF